MAVIDLEGCRPSQPGLQALQVENPSTNPIPAYMTYKRKETHQTFKFTIDV